MQVDRLVTRIASKLKEKKAGMYVDFFVGILLMALLGVAVLFLVQNLVMSTFTRMNTEVVNSFDVINVESTN